MYDMYSWDQAPSPADEDAEVVPPPSRTPAQAASRAATAAAARAETAAAARAETAAAASATTAAPDHARAALAVQVALDRRDNGGDADPGQPA